MKAWMLFALAAAVPVGAQTRGTIAPGMSEAEVRAAFGPPTLTRAAADRTYLFYANGCPVQCGSDDVVFLESGRVVTAVLRAPGRRFAGRGIAGPPPAGAPGLANRAGETDRAGAAPLQQGIRLQVPNSGRTSVGSGRPSRRIVVGPREGEIAAPADGFRSRREPTSDTIRGPLQRADTAAALSPPNPVPGTPPASTAPARPQQQQQPSQPRAPR